MTIGRDIDYITDLENSRKVYRKKPSGRYEEVGEKFKGFPVDGIWLVWDGRKNCITKIGDIVGKDISSLKGIEYAVDMIEKKLLNAKGFSRTIASIANEIVNDLYGLREK